MQMLMTACLVFVVSGAPGPVLVLDDDGLPPSLTLPDGPTVPMPPGTELFGPHRFDSKSFPNLPSPEVARPGDKVVPTPPPVADDPDAGLSPQDRRKRRIDDLFARLADASDETEAQAITQRLDRLWLQSGSATADLLTSRALTAMAGNEHSVAEELLDKVVTLRPDWPEGWNQRATLHYLDNDDVTSMADIGHVLLLEPRHFGALSGMGFILHRNGDDKAALTVLRKAAAINPQNKEINALIEQLTPDVEGHDL